MHHQLDRRDFLSQTLCGVAAMPLLPRPLFGAEPAFRISLAQWSLHRRLRGEQQPVLDNLDFAKTARDFGIDAIEYVNTFFRDQVADHDYLEQMKKRADDHGVRALLIMCDGLGHLGDADDDKRRQAVENHYPWVEAAKLFGCHSIRVNARSSGSFEEQMARAADGLRKLAEFGDEHDINVIVENHGGLSSNGKWLAGVMAKVDHPRCGTLPDFGNFLLHDDEWYDRYQGVREMMPFAKAVSAKSHAFDDDGNETATDYEKMIKIVLDAGYRGYVGIEFEGAGSEDDGIVKTKALLERVRTRLARAR